MKKTRINSLREVWNLTKRIREVRKGMRITQGMSQWASYYNEWAAYERMREDAWRRFCRGGAQ